MPTDKARNKAKEEERARLEKEAAPVAEPPKRKLNRIGHGKFVSSKDDKQLSFGGSKGGGSNDSMGIVLKEWQRLPKTLLQEHCQSTKAPKPEYYANARGGEHLCRVRLPDGKNKEKDVHINCPVGAPSAQDAAHRAALYALYVIGPTVQHHRKLPDLYRDLWLEWQANPPARPHGSGGRGGGFVGNFQIAEPPSVGMSGADCDASRVFASSAPVN